MEHVRTLRGDDEIKPVCAKRLYVVWEVKRKKKKKKGMLFLHQSKLDRVNHGVFIS